jgi:molybdopterin-synthase adenylyltransferase
MSHPRYSKNRKSLSEAENVLLQKSKVCVVGCGGLGGNIIEMLGRIGIGNMTVVDGDVFDETNLNRQILSDVSNLGTSKALAAVKRMTAVNPDISVIPVQTRLTAENARKILSGHHVIVDAVDNIKSRFLLEENAEVLGTPLVYGAVAGWYGQVATIFPGDRLLKRIYRNAFQPGVEKNTGNMSFGPALIAALEVGEVVKILTGRNELLRGKMLYADLAGNEYKIIDFLHSFSDGSPKEKT